MASYRFATLDVFTTQRFKGNQLGLVHVPKDRQLTQEQKLEIAVEFGYSETVFLHDDSSEAEQARRLDIFTTLGELPFAGHPTIGTLCYIAQEELGGKDANIRLQLKAGLVEAKYDASTKRAVAAVPHKVNIHAHKIEAAELYMYQTDLAKDSIKPFNDVVSIVRGMTFAMIPLPTLDELGRVQIPAEAINMVFDAGWDDGFVGQMWFVDLGAGADGVRNLRTRMMSSRSMGEDAATGSASCGLGVYLALKDGKGDGEYKFAMTQGVEMGRKSEISIRVMLDASGKSVETVELGGSAVTVMRGEMDVA